MKTEVLTIGGLSTHGGKVEAASPVFSNADKRGYGTRITIALPGTTL
jgi:hypothetical protein